MRKMGPNCEALFHSIRNSYPNAYTHPPYKKWYEAARALINYGLIEPVDKSFRRTYRLTQEGRLIPVYIVKYTSKNPGFLPSWQGPAGLCVNSGVRVPHTSVMRREDAYMYLSELSAKRATRDCNDRWIGSVETLNPIPETEC